MSTIEFLKSVEGLMGKAIITVIDRISLEIGKECISVAFPTKYALIGTKITPAKMSGMNDGQESDGMVHAELITAYGLRSSIVDATPP